MRNFLFNAAKLASLLVSASFVFSRNALAGPISDLNDPQPFSSLGSILSKAFSLALLIAGMLATLILIWGGFRYMAAQGDEKMVASARSTITGAVIGLAIILSLGIIAYIIGVVLKVDILTGNII